MSRVQYQAYLQSPHWQDVKRRYRASKQPQACFCGETRVDLHHRTYANLGNERLRDLVPLCRKHHEQVHAMGAAWGDHRKLRSKLYPRVSTPEHLAERRHRRRCRRQID